MRRFHKTQEADPLSASFLWEASGAVLAQCRGKENGPRKIVGRFPVGVVARAMGSRLSDSVGKRRRWRETEGDPIQNRVEKNVPKKGA